MAGTLMPWWQDQFCDSNGSPLASGTVETFEAGTNTPLATYSDAGLTVSNGTTLTLNAGGFPSVANTEVGVFLLPRAYKFVLKNSAGVTVRTRDNVYALQAASATNLEIDGTAGEALSAGEWAYESDGSGGLTAGRWYKADADLGYASVLPNLAFVPSAVASGAVGTFRRGGVADGLSGLSAGMTYYVSSTAGAITNTAPMNARAVGVARSATVIDLDFSPRWLVDGTPFVCEGRLTLTTGTPVTTGDVTAATTLFFAPYKGNRIALFDGSKWIVRAFTQLSIAVPATTSTMYDVFAYDNAGTVTLELTAWTNDTTRATALTTQDGVLAKTGVLTRRYLGSFRTTGVSGQTEDSFAKRYVWNYYNRVPRVLRRLESTASWTYTTATVRQARADTANQLDMVIGVAEVALEATLTVTSLNSSADIQRNAGFGEDSTTTMMATQTYNTNNVLAASTAFIHTASIRHYPAVGRHFYSWNETSAATGTTTWQGVTAAGNPNSLQSGMVGMIQG